MTGQAQDMRAGSLKARPRQFGHRLAWGVARRAWRLRRASTSSIFSGKIEIASRFLGRSSQPEDDPSSFAVGGKGFASAPGAADARKNEL